MILYTLWNATIRPFPMLVLGAGWCEPMSPAPSCGTFFHFALFNFQMTAVTRNYILLSSQFTTFIQSSNIFRWWLNACQDSAMDSLFLPSSSSARRTVDAPYLFSGKLLKTITTGLNYNYKFYLLSTKLLLLHLTSYYTLILTRGFHHQKLFRLSTPYILNLDTWTGPGSVLTTTKRKST